MVVAGTVRIGVSQLATEETNYEVSTSVALSVGEVPSRGESVCWPIAVVALGSRAARIPLVPTVSAIVPVAAIVSVSARGTDRRILAGIAPHC